MVARKNKLATRGGRFNFCFSNLYCWSRKVMLYKPKFCCSCGEEIERVNWSLTDSRRFCQLCETQYKVYDWLPRLAVAFGILTGILGLGFYWQKPENAANILPRQIAESNRSANKNLTSQINSLQLSANQIVQESAQVKQSAVQTQNKPQIASVKPSLPAATSKQIENQTTSATEKLYFCGAATKKGTPCSRRVKGGGRCWQHAGQTAMLPQEKLIAEN